MQKIALCADAESERNPDHRRRASRQRNGEFRGGERHVSAYRPRTNNYRYERA